MSASRATTPKDFPVPIPNLNESVHAWDGDSARASRQLLGRVACLPLEPRSVGRALFIARHALSEDPSLMTLLRKAARRGWAVVVMDNMPDIALGRIRPAEVTLWQAELADVMANAGVPLSGYFVCPHAPRADCPESQCLCQWPEAGLFHQAAAALSLHLPSCVMVGVGAALEAGQRAGCVAVAPDPLVAAGHGWTQLAERLERSEPRRQAFAILKAGGRTALPASAAVSRELQNSSDWMPAA